MKVCFVAITRGARRSQQRVARGVRRIHQFLRSAADSTSGHPSKPLSHPHLRRAASSHSVRTAWLDARMQPGFCSFHLMHARVAAPLRRALCGALEGTYVTLSNQSSNSQAVADEGGFLGAWGGAQVVGLVGAVWDVGRNARDDLADFWEWLRGLLEGGLEILFGPLAAELVEGWFGPTGTTWKGVIPRSYQLPRP